MALKASELQEGQTHEAVVVENLTRTQIGKYAAASGDFNPLHLEDGFARDVAGYPSVFAHGMLSMGLTGRMLTDWVGDGRLRTFGVRFVKQVFPGDTLTARATVRRVFEQDGEKRVELALETVNQNGEAVVTGTATAKVD